YSCSEQTVWTKSPVEWTVGVEVTGLGVGIVFSVLLFKRRTWPVAFGSGLGVGMGYTNCQNDFRLPYLIHGRMVKDQ
uniref:MICOS complex subunit MIC10 n=1 Tax=Amphiprion ocellaris TaxID=80972 RepID=A0A3Q1CBM0_AMPOC